MKKTFYQIYVLLKATHWQEKVSDLFIIVTTADRNLIGKIYTPSVSLFNNGLFLLLRKIGFLSNSKCRACLKTWDICLLRLKSYQKLGNSIRRCKVIKQWNMFHSLSFAEYLQRGDALK